MKSLSHYYISRRDFLRLTAVGLGGWALAACSRTQSSSSTPVFKSQAPVGLTPNAEEQQSTGGFQVLLANSEQVVGPNRVAMGLIDNGRAVTDAQVQVQFFDLNSDQPLLKGQAPATFYGDNLGAAGVYVTHFAFDKAGRWGTEVTAQSPGQSVKTARIGFQVLAEDPTPAIGSPALHTRSRTLKDVGGDRSKICSAVDDDSPLHQLSIADAVTSGRPTLILFATPGFCTSRTCGPSLEVVKSIALNHQGPVNFIHVEVYSDFQSFTVSEAMQEWRLQSEPWLFFVNKDGIITEKFEGGITLREVEPEFLKFIGA